MLRRLNFLTQQVRCSAAIPKLPCKKMGRSQKRIPIRIHRPLEYERVYLPLHVVADTPFHIQGDEISNAVLNICERTSSTNRLTPGEYFSWTHAPPAPVELSGFYPHKSTPGTIKRSQLPLEVETCRVRTPAAQSVKGGTTDFPRRV